MTNEEIDFRDKYYGDFCEGDAIIYITARPNSYNSVRPDFIIGVVNKMIWEEEKCLIFTREYLHPPNGSYESDFMLKDEIAYKNCIVKRMVDVAKGDIIAPLDDTLEAFFIIKWAYNRQRRCALTAYKFINKFEADHKDYKESLYDEIAEINKIYDERTMIYRIRGDYQSWCELGMNFFSFPVYCCDALKVDFKANMYMHIDPNLFMIKLDKNEFIHKALKVGETFKGSKYGKNDSVDYETLNIRGRYQWIPAIFSEDEQGQILIVSPIHNLQRRSEFEDEYKNIALIFQSMLPIFNQFDAFKDREKKEKFKVIVESQKDINDIGLLNGKRNYHMIGMTEHILLCGVYIIEGNGDFVVKFMGAAKYAAGFPYFHGEEYVEYELIKESAFVFENINCIHKWKKKKDCKNEAKLSYIAFYMIDPKMQDMVQSTEDIACLNKDVYWMALCEVLNENDYYFTNDICQIIMEYSVDMDMMKSGKEADEIRKEIIENEVKYAGRWGFKYCQNGDGGWNCFFPFYDYLPWITYKKYCQLLYGKEYEWDNTFHSIEQICRYGRSRFDVVEPSDNEIDYYHEVIQKQRY